MKYYCELYGSSNRTVTVAAKLQCMYVRSSLQLLQSFELVESGQVATSTVGQAAPDKTRVVPSHTSQVRIRGVCLVQWKFVIKNTFTVNFCHSERFHVAQYMFYCGTLAG